MPRAKHSVALAFGFALALTGCSSTEVDLPNDPRASDTGQFPSFAAAPVAAAPQLTEAQKLASIRELVLAGDEARIEAGMPMSDPRMVALLGEDAVRQAMVGMSEVQRLRFLRRVHEQRTIERIESRSS